MKSLLKNKTAIGVFFSISLVIIFGLLAYGKFFELAQLRLADFLYGYSVEPRQDIVLVEVDEKSISDEHGLGAYQNWDRTYFAKVLDNINIYNPKIVVLDFKFSAEKTPQENKKLLDSLSVTQKVILGFIGTPNNRELGYFSRKPLNIAVTEILPLFLQPNSVTAAIANLMRDSDDTARRFIPIIYDEEKNLSHETISLATARKVLDGEDLPATPPIENYNFILSLKNGKNIEIPLEEGQMLINFFSKMNGPRYPKISFADVYKKNYGSQSPAQLFNNKIVLIGPTAYSFKDSFPTPVTNTVLMPGLELHANAIQTIIEQKFLRNMTFPEKSGLIVFLAVLGTFIFMFTKIRWSLLFLAASIIGYSLLAPFAFQHGLILDLVHPYLVLITAFVACYMYRYVTEFREKTALRTAFSKYVNAQLVEQISAHPEQLKLGGEKKNVTVLFTDIVHFTNLSEGLKPESLVALLNEYFEAMSEVILKEGGTLDKFEGDAIMAFFGAPLDQPDHALRATKAAMNMRKKLHTLLQKWQNDPPLPGGEKKPMIDFRAGISSGNAIVGNIGSSERFDYTAMGDIVNLGSRLEGANKKYGTHIMVSEATYTQVKDFFEGRELDVIKVVGKSQPIRVYEIIAEKGQLPAEATTLLKLYNEGIELYHGRHFGEAVDKFKQILQTYPQDMPSQLYLQRCEVLRDFPPKPDWDGVFEMGSK